MNQLKRILGLVWIALALAAAYFLHLHFWSSQICIWKTDLVFGIILLYSPLIVLGLGTWVLCANG
jgi:hypothetical protein